MGAIFRTKEVKELDPWNYKAEKNSDGTEKHISQNGARYHVISYHGFNPRMGEMESYNVCSCANCEINKREHARMLKEHGYDIKTKKYV